MLGWMLKLYNITKRTNLMVQNNSNGIDVVEPLNREADLIERSQAGDEQAFQELVNQYRTRVASIAYQVLGNYEDARDVSQEVFIKLYRGLKGFDPKKKFFTWLYRLTVNAAIDFLRSKKRRSQEFSIDERPNQYQDIPASELESVTYDFERKELRQIFHGLADRLNPKQKAAFVLCDLQGFSADEVADMLNCPKVTLRWYLHEARKRIRKMIARDHPEYLMSRSKLR